MMDRSARTQTQEKPKKLSSWPQEGRFGSFGGRYVPEIFMPALQELEKAYHAACEDLAFQQELRRFQTDYCGRPTPLYFARRLTESCRGARIYFKREDLLHGGSHTLNNAIGQALLARRMGKARLVADTGAGDHGVATAMAGAALGLQTEIYMGEVDMQHQQLNVLRMQSLGAKVHCVKTGTATVKDAINEAFRDWATNARTTHYVISSAIGPHPYPLMVRDFQRIIGEELKGQILRKERRLPDLIIACVGGGSNAVGTFHSFIDDEWVKLLGVEAGGSANGHAGAVGHGRVGVFHGAKSYVLQDEWGQTKDAHSLATGLAYPAVGPELAFCHEMHRVEYITVTDEQALEGFRQLSELEGISPALECAHAVYAAVERAKLLGRDGLIVVTLSGRGDKDLGRISEHHESHSNLL